MYYKLGQACVINQGSFVLLQIRANFFNKLGQLHCYELGEVSLQIGADISN